MTDNAETPNRSLDARELLHADIQELRDIIAKQEAEIVAARAGLEQSDAWLTDTNIRLEKAEAELAAAEARERKLREANDDLRSALKWYGENARLARLIHSEGDKGRNALARDGGEMARICLAALTDTASAGDVRRKALEEARGICQEFARVLLVARDQSVAEGEGDGFGQYGYGAAQLEGAARRIQVLIDATSSQTVPTVQCAPGIA